MSYTVSPSGHCGECGEPYSSNPKCWWCSQGRHLHPASSLPPPETAGLHPSTTELVNDFAKALAEKLRAAELKYGYTDGWREEWQEECREQLYAHLAKGDPRDVAIYCAFMWWHGYSTVAPETAEGEWTVEKLKQLMRLADFQLRLTTAEAALSQLQDINNPMHFGLHPPKAMLDSHEVATNALAALGAKDRAKDSEGPEFAQLLPEDQDKIRRQQQ